LPDGLLRHKTRIVAAEDQLNFLQANLDWNFFSRLWLKFFQQTLIEIFSADFDWKFSSKVWFTIFKRDHDRDWKCEPERSRFDWIGIDRPCVQMWWRSRGFAPPLRHPQLR
jgi:hypothetical protein